ncbi:MAG TPA: asparagine synthase-related protein [Stellaceae bacterium]|nr:asparagine synthase-related protein [Stellaceae bacterium]
MSRIAGLVSPRAAARLPHMTDALSHSGLSRTGALGHAALAWRGTEEGRFARAQDCIAVIDGRILNRPAPEAAEDAGDAGFFIALYRRHGFVGALEKLIGDFAIALYDKDADRLFLGRDRVGVKPLYYVERPDLFAFASRPRALLALPEVPATINRRFAALFAASHYRAIDNAPHDSPYAAIKQLPAGHLLEVAGGSARIRRWWDVAEAEDWRDDEATLAERYRELLQDAVRLRLSAASRPGFMLSGGMDSSSVLATAVALTGARQHAYSSVYADKTFDESDDIGPMLEEKVAAWRQVPLGDDVDVFGLVAEMVAAHDEPVATATWLSHFTLCRQAASDGIETLFGGLGGDELNAGEYEYFIFHFADLRAERRDAELRHEIACWARHHDHPIFRKNAAVAEAALARLTDPAARGRVRTDRARLTRYYEALDPACFDLSDFAPALDHPFTSWLKNRTYQDIFRETAPCCLRAEDRHAALFGLEHFDPFFDHRLVEFMFRVPGSMKIRDGVTKRLLREAMRGILPEATRARIKKTGWNAPAHRWFSGARLDQLRDLVGSRAFRERGIYRPRVVERLITEHAAIVAGGAPRENHMMFLWQLLNLETWLARMPESVRTPA